MKMEHHAMVEIKVNGEAVEVTIHCEQCGRHVLSIPTPHITTLASACQAVATDMGLYGTSHVVGSDEETRHLVRRH